MLQRLVPEGYGLCIGTTEAISVTAETAEARRFISRARVVSKYEELLAPYHSSPSARSWSSRLTRTGERRPAFASQVAAGR